MSTKRSDIIETDEDTRAEDSPDDGSLYPYDPMSADLDITEIPFSVFEYLRKYQLGKLITQPDFQRKLVWSAAQKSKFIESIILNFPIPPIYLNEDIESKYMIIDGLQRTTTLLEFYDGQFQLSGLEALPSFNGKYFDNLTENLKSKFEDKKLIVFVLKPSTPLKVIYDLFNRINTGGTQLNRQEVRNCIFFGHSTKLLKELSEQDYFKKAIDNGIKDTRMKDRETVLRYIAFRWFDRSNYTDMSDFVESAMKAINRMDETRIESIRNDFRRVMEWSIRLWGKLNFRIPKGKSRGSINTAVLETVSNFLASKSDSFLKRNATQIKRNYKKLISDPIFLDAVTTSTGNRGRVANRFQRTNALLKKGTK